MPPLPGKTKPKGRDQGRSSGSRNTTPSSNISAPISTSTTTAISTAFLEIPVSDLTIPKDVSYDDILERHGGVGGIPDPKHLETMADNLKSLSQRAQIRGQACDGAMRELVARQKEIRLEDERVKEKAIKDKAAQEAAERESLRKAAEEEEGAKSKKALKKKKKKEQSVKEERPLTHGAHGLAKQDGSDFPMKGMA